MSRVKFEPSTSRVQVLGGYRYNNVLDLPVPAT